MMQYATMQDELIFPRSADSQALWLLRKWGHLMVMSRECNIPQGLVVTLG